MANRFNYHQPDNDTADRHQFIRDAHANIAHDILLHVPPGREQSLALTNLEQSMFWANAGIARKNKDGSCK